MSEVTRNVISLLSVENVVQKNYRPIIWKGINAGLGVIASLSLKSRQHCVALNYEGRSGAGKSVIIQILTPPDERTGRYLKRVDDLTPASFVSAAANRTADQLESIDLLPQIKDKVMLTKELAPIFRDQEDNLRRKFAMLTSVLDGDGLKRSSGTHGMRGYEGRYLFNWLGGTTPIPAVTYKVMSQLGNRFLFFEVFGQDSSEPELLVFAKGNKGYESLEQCRSITQNFILLYFQSHPVNSVDPDSIEITDDLQLNIVRLALLVSHGRIELEWADSPLAQDKKKQLVIGESESPHRVILLLQTIARGLALAAGRSHVTPDDLEIIKHIAISSIPLVRRQVLRAVISHGGQVNAAQMESVLNVSRPTVLTRMSEFGATGIADFSGGIKETSTATSLKLNEKWRWVLNDPPLK